MKIFIEQKAMQTLPMRVQNECNSGLESEDELKEDPCFDLTSFQPWARDNVCSTIWSSLCTKMKLFFPLMVRLVVKLLLHSSNSD